MNRSLHRCLILLFAALVLPACSGPVATDGELEQMCEHLRELRDEKPDAEAVKACVKEARAEAVTQKQARCRISAVNKTEYWVRCRTGEARKP